MKPLAEFISENNLDKELNENFLSILNILSAVLSEKSETLKIRPVEPASEIRKELVISELETKLNGQLEKSIMLENKIFSLEKSIFALKTFQNDEMTSSDSPSKRPRLEQGKDSSSISNVSEDQEIMAKLNVTVAELDEYKKISKNHLAELESLQSQNKKLFEELDSKKEQVFIFKKIRTFMFNIFY